MPVSIRQAGRRDIRQAAATLGRAFADDPVMLWMMPDGERIQRLFEALLQHLHVRNGSTELAESDGRVTGVAVWDPPGYRPSPLQVGRFAVSVIRAMGKRATYGQALEETFERFRPKQPHWYLAHLGTDPDAQGTGVGTRLLRSRLDRCDARGEPAYLESSKHANVPFYERFGFVVREEVTLPRNGPTCWTMWRDPA
jgi:GNAT superfamily N-acetyltransferase